MKVTKIKLNSFLHFKKGLEIDLTYPEGHARAGAPLDKICLIGQTATGKTALLNLLKCCICDGSDVHHGSLDKCALIANGVQLFYRLDNKNYSTISAGDSQFEYFDHSNPDEPKRIDYVADFKKISGHWLKQSTPVLISFPFCVVLPEEFNEETLAAFKSVSTDSELRSFHPGTGELSKISKTDRRIWDFTPATIRAVWNIVFTQVDHYMRAQQLEKAKLFDEISADAESVAAILKKFSDELHPNPIKKLAEKCLNPIFNHFGLSIETDLSKYRSKDNLGGHSMHVIVKDQRGNEIPYPFLSTGTKQILLTAVPLFFLEPHNSIILFDQPETSLFPNIQSMLPQIYLECASDNNQFVFATHSPIVASSFEPWEIVELKQNKDGDIERREYYRGARHVDNYYIKPKLLRWDSVYRILFDLEDEGNEERTKKLMDLAILDQQIKDSVGLENKRELSQKYDALAQELDWNIN